MPFYAFGTIPLIKACKVDDMTGEVWFADDATGCAKLEALSRWRDNLTTCGPSFGYFPQNMADHG